MSRALFVGIALLLAGPARADTAATLDGALDHETLVFRLELENTGGVIEKLTQIGVQSRVEGRFSCMPFYPHTVPLADYIVRFHVQDREKLQAAEPVLTIDPHTKVGFTVTLVPDDTGSCGFWRAAVSVVAVLDDGTKVVSPPATITQPEAHAAGARQLPISQLAAAAAHGDVELRRNAAKRLRDADVPRRDALELLAKLAADPDGKTQEAAMVSIGARQLGELAPQLLRMLDREIARLGTDRTRNEETSAALARIATALGELRTAQAVKPIAALLLDERMTDASQLDNALLAFHLPAVTTAMAELVRRRPSWSLRTASDDQQSRYATAVRTLVASKDATAVPLLDKLLRDALVDRVADDIMYECHLIGENDHSPEARAFLAKMAPVLVHAIEHHHDYFWGLAIGVVLDDPEARKLLTHDVIARQLDIAGDLSAPATAAVELGYTDLYQRACGGLAEGNFTTRLRTALEKAGVTCPAR